MIHPTRWYIYGRFGHGGRTTRAEDDYVWTFIEKIRTIFLDYWKENNERLRSGTIAYRAVTPFPSLSLSLSLSLLNFKFLLLFNIILFNGWDKVTFSNFWSQPFIVIA